MPCLNAMIVDWEFGLSHIFQPTTTPLLASKKAVRYSLCIVPPIVCMCVCVLGFMLIGYYGKIKKGGE